MVKKNLLILIVDDAKDNRLAVKISLKNEDYILEEATNGQEAIDKCKKLKPDVILMDAMMPVLDGYEATREIRALEEFDRVPILMITALSGKEDKIKALKAGVNDFISKPFDKQELIARCRSYVNFSKINKQYILASKNPSTNLPNKSVLIKDIGNCINPKLILFRIEDYELLEEFYTEKIASKVEYQFAQHIYDLVPPDCKDALLYHINEGEFALLKDEVYNTISDDRLYQNCEIFYNNTENHTILLDGYKYEISIILSYAKDIEHLFENARIGLNYAKKERKNIVNTKEVVKQIHNEALNNIKTIQMVKKALNDEKVISYFQPIYNNQTKKIEKYESLVRIIDDKSNIISPYLFLDISKQGKYYTHITQAVLQNSFRALELTTKDITINISGIDIEDRYIKNKILNFCKSNREFSQRITFELLEDENFKDFVLIKRFIEDVKGYGAKIAIDDFGSGFSNFERLLEFQPDILKIDGSLIKNINATLFNRGLVETITDFAKKMKIKTVAEFVHNQEVFDTINEMGIDYTQGYFIGEPKPIEAFKKEG